MLRGQGWQRSPLLPAPAAAMGHPSAHPSSAPQGLEGASEETDLGFFYLRGGTWLKPSRQQQGQEQELAWQLPTPAGARTWDGGTRGHAGSVAAAAWSQECTARARDAANPQAGGSRSHSMYGPGTGRGNTSGLFVSQGHWRAKGDRR